MGVTDINEATDPMLKKKGQLFIATKQLLKQQRSWASPRLLTTSQSRIQLTVLYRHPLRMHCPSEKVLLQTNSLLLYPLSLP